VIIVSLLDPARPRWTNLALGLLRVVAALVFMQHGSQKLFHFPPSGAPGPGGPFVLMSQTGIAGIIEFFGGMLLLLGLFTRPVAFLQSGEMAVAYFQVHLAGTYSRVHSSSAFLPIVNRGELAVILCFVFLYLAFAGGGAFSVDAVLRRRRTSTEPPLRAD
jgi:putative oxidoreductase